MATFLASAVAAAGTVNTIAGVNNIFYAVLVGIDNYHDNQADLQVLRLLIKSIADRWTHVREEYLVHEQELVTALQDALIAALRTYRHQNDYSRLRRFCFAGRYQNKIGRHMALIQCLDRQLAENLRMRDDFTGSRRVGPSSSDEEGNLSSTAQLAR